MGICGKESKEREKEREKEKKGERRRRKGLSPNICPCTSKCCKMVILTRNLKESDMRVIRARGISRN
jgi:hypothetical protein